MRIAIDGRAGTGKTTVGVRLALRLHRPYVESGYWFRGAAVQRDLDLADIDIGIQVPPAPDWRPRLVVGGAECCARTAEIDRRLAVIAADDRVRGAIIAAARHRLDELTDGFVVVGRRTALELAPQADAAVRLTASEEVRSRRRGVRSAAELEIQRARDGCEVVPPESYTLTLDTSDLSPDEVFERVLCHVEGDVR